MIIHFHKLFILVFLFIFFPLSRVFAEEAISCSDGNELLGAPPPKGRKVWCQKADETGNLVKNGIYMEWYTDGKIRLQGQYQDDKKIGLWRSFLRTGGLKSVEHWENGLKEGKSIEYYGNNVPKAQGEYVAGKKQGKWTAWHKSGQIKSEGAFEKGKAIGIWTYWSKHGVKDKVVDRSKKGKQKKHQKNSQSGNENEATEESNEGENDDQKEEDDEKEEEQLNPTKKVPRTPVKRNQKDNEIISTF